MLKYMIQATGDLLSTAVLVGLVLAYLRSRWGKAGRVYATAGIVAGCVGAAVVALLKSNTNWVDTPMVETTVGLLSGIALVLFLVLSIPGLANRLKGIGDNVRMMAAAVMLFANIVFALPAVLMYPNNFNTQGNGLASTDFVYRAIGMAVGIVLMLLVLMAVYRVAVRLEGRTPAVLAVVGLVVVNVSQLMTAFQTLMVRHIIGRTAFTFNLVKHDDSEVFMYIMVVLALVVAIMLLARSTRVREPYDNPAQHRKIRAKWRNRRRWSAVLVVCIALSVLNVTALEAYDSKEIELSPTEECDIHDDACYVSFEQVADGHLHRFKYTTDDGKNLRFIVIKKPNSSSYGVGLDACDICGETGYFERDGQVVCKLCDVVMNINTIGFKGGCNPIVIDYSVKDGHIIVPIDSLLEYKDTFTGKFD